MTNKELYLKELKRLRKGYKQTYEKRGFIDFDYLNFEAPNRVTKKQLNKIRELKPSDIAINVYEDVAGNSITKKDLQQVKQFKELPQLQTTDEPEDVTYNSDVIRFLENLNAVKYDVSLGSGTLQELKSNWIDELINLVNDIIDVEGEFSLGKRLRENYFQINRFTEIIMYESEVDTILYASQELFEIVQGSKLSNEQDDLFENQSIIYKTEKSLY